MSEDKEKTIIFNNYFTIQIKNPNDILNLDFIKHAFQPMYKDYMIKSYLLKKREGPQNKIILKEEEHKDSESKKENYKINEDGSLSTNNSDIVVELPIDKTHLFLINNKKKVGRKPKSSIFRGEHTKYSCDNILRKIKVKFFKIIIKYINSIIAKYNKIYNITFLLPIKGKYHQDNGINFNKKLLNSKLKDIFLEYEINDKFKLFKKYYNEDVINSIYENNIEELINILDMTFIEVFKIFRTNDETNKLQGLEKLDTVVKEMKKIDNNKDYIGKFIKVVNNFENYYLNKNGRK